MAEWAGIEDWLPKTEIRTVDSRLTGVRLPLSESQVRKIASRDLLMCEFGDINWFRNCMTMNARRLIQHVDAVSSWHNEGGK